MEKGRGKRTDTLQTDKVFTRKEYIEREAAREKCCSMCSWEGTTNCEECEHPIDDIPAADVVPVRHGRWVTVFDIGTVCNQCGYDIEQHGFDVRTDGEPRYCPNCGAQMRDGDV